MELFDNLSSVGLTTRVLQFIIIGSILVFLVGMYWRFIVVGAGILFCVVVFAMPSSKPESIVVNTEAVKEVKPEDVVPKEFLEDCREYHGGNKEECEKDRKSTRLNSSHT